MAVPYSYDSMPDDGTPSGTLRGTALDPSSPGFNPGVNPNAKPFDPYNEFNQHTEREDNDPYSAITARAKADGGIGPAVIDAMADHSNQQNVFGNLVSGAKEGKNFQTQMDDMAKWKEQMKQNEIARDALMSKRAKLHIAPTDSSSYDAATAAYQQGMGEGPTAPHIVTPQSTDLEKIIGAIAIATGTPVQHVLAGLGALAGARANQTNQGAMQDYSIKNNEHQDNMSQLRFGMQTAGQRMDRQDAQNLKDYSAEDKSLEGQIASMDRQDAIAGRKEIAGMNIDGRKDIADQKHEDHLKTIENQLHYRLSSEQANIIKQMGDGTMSTFMKANAIERLKTLEKLRFPDNPELQVFNRAKSEDIQKFIDETSPKVDAIKAKMTLAELKDYQSQAKNFIDQRMRSKAGFTQEAQDKLIEFIGKLPKELQSKFIVPGVMESYNAFDARVRAIETNRHNTVTEGIAGRNATTSAGREKRLGGSLDLGDGIAIEPPAKPPTPAQKAKALKDIAAYQAVIDKFPADDSTWTLAQNKVKDISDYLQNWIDPNPAVRVDMFGVPIAVENTKKVQPKGSLPPASGTKNGNPISGKPNPQSKPAANKPTTKTKDGKVKTGGVTFNPKPRGK